MDDLHELESSVLLREIKSYVLTNQLTSGGDPEVHLLSNCGFSAASNDASKGIQVSQTDRLTHRHPRG